MQPSQLFLGSDGFQYGWGEALSYNDLDDLDKQADQDSKSDLVDQHEIGRQAKILALLNFVWAALTIIVVFFVRANTISIKLVDFTRFWADLWPDFEGLKSIPETQESGYFSECGSQLPELHWKRDETLMHF